MKIFLIGCGSIGERHLKNLISIKAGEIFCFDTNIDRLKEISSKYKVDFFTDINEGFKQKPDLVLVCTPPSIHYDILKTAVEHDSNVFVEKPISNDLKGLDDLLKKATDKGLFVFVGYNLRFQRGIRFLKEKIDEGLLGRIFFVQAEFGQYLPDWRPWQDYTKSYTANKSLGGGIILDGSHEIDFVRWFIGDVSEVCCFADKLSNLKVDVEDTAEILLRFDNGCFGSVHLDFVQKGYHRTCRVVGEKGSLFFDYPTGVIEFYKNDSDKPLIYDVKCDGNSMYLDEMKHVVNCLNGVETPLVDGYSGKRVLEIALAAKKSALKAEVISL